MIKKFLSLHQYAASIILAVALTWGWISASYGFLSELKETIVCLIKIAREETDGNAVYFGKTGCDVRSSNAHEGFYQFKGMHIREVQYDKLHNDFYYEEGHSKNYLSTKE